MRNLYKDEFMKKHDIKLGFMSMFVAGIYVCMYVCVRRVREKARHETGLHVYVRDWYVNVCVYVSV